MAPTKMLHSCEKPVALLELLINELTNEDDLVADFFVGSGSTIEACIKTKRRFIGFELDKNYYEIANKRIRNLVA